jgi:hypothetical protein
MFEPIICPRASAADVELFLAPLVHIIDRLRGIGHGLKEAVSRNSLVCGIPNSLMAGGKG